MIALAGLMDRYGEAITADLAMLPAGWDVVDLWEQGRYAFTLNLIDHLPRASAYRQALAEDDEWAEQLPYEALVPRGDVRPLWSEWTPEVEMLAAAVDRLGENIAAQVAAAGGKPGHVKPWPRPESAAERVRRRREQEMAERVIGKAFPDWKGGA